MMVFSKSCKPNNTLIVKITKASGDFLEKGKASDAIIKNNVKESVPTQKYAVLDTGMAAKIKKDKRAKCSGKKRHAVCKNKSVKAIEKKR